MSDTLYPSVVFLPRFSAAGSVPAADKTGKALTAAGDAAIVSDAGSLFGFALSLDGTGDYVTTPGVDGLQLGAGDFTVEIRFKTSGSGKCLLDYYSGASTGWQIFLNASGYIEWYNGSTVKTGAIAVNNNAWHHAAITRASGKIYLWIDGVQDGAFVANTINHNVNTTYLSLGAQVSVRSAGYDLAGLIDYARVTPGTARYTAAFTPPVAADIYPGYLALVSDSIQMNAYTLRAMATPAAASDLAFLSGAATGSPHGVAADGISLSVSALSTRARGGVLSESLSISAAAAVKATLQGSLTAALLAGDAVQAMGVLRASVVDGIDLFEAQALGGLIDDALSVWVANVATAAHSRYAQYGFNSFARFGGKHYGCKSDGIYLLDGNADGAVPIKWTVTFPESDFGSSNLKRFESVYIGAKATGQIVLKVVQDAAHVYHYNVTPSGNDARAARALLGRGSVGRYWQFELASDTERAELDSIDYSFSILSRRI